MPKPIVCFFMSIVSVTAYGQNESHFSGTNTFKPQKLFVSNIGILVGPSLIYYHGDELSEDARDPKYGYSINLALGHQFSSMFETYLELGYQKKGSKSIVYSFNTDYTPPASQKHISNVTLNYYTVTLLTKYSFTQKRRLFIGLGPYFGYLHSTSFKKELYLNGSLVTKSSGRPDPSLAGYKEYDFGVTSVIGYNINVFKKRRTNILLEYTYGMTNINEAMMTQTRNNTLSALLFISLSKDYEVRP